MKPALYTASFTASGDTSPSTMAVPVDRSVVTFSAPLRAEIALVTVAWQ